MRKYQNKNNYEAYSHLICHFVSYPTEIEELRKGRHQVYCKLIGVRALAHDLLETKRGSDHDLTATCHFDLSTHQSGLEAGQANHRGAREHLNEHAGAEDLVEIVYYSEQTLMVADGPSEPLGEVAANRIRIAIILFAGRRRYLKISVPTGGTGIISLAGTAWRPVAAAALKMRVQDLELHEKQNAYIGEQAVYPDDGGHADGDAAGLDEEADLMPRIHGRVEGIPRPDGKLPVLHGHDEQQADHDGEAEDAKPAEGHAAEQQILVQDFVLDAN